MPRRARPRNSTTGCIFCHATTVEPPRNRTRITDANGGNILVCAECRLKARRRELVSSVRPARQIALAPRDPRVAVAQQVEEAYSFAGIRTTLEAEDDCWEFIAILDDRLVKNENTTDRVRDAQQFRQLFFAKLVALPSDGELHALVGRSRITFNYNSRDFEREVRQARPAEQQGMDDVEPWPDPVDGAAVLSEVVAKNAEFLVIKAEEFDAIALWDALTHCFQAFDFCPYLRPKSAEKRCAKTRVQDVNAPMSGTPVVATSLRPETLFRLLEKYHPAVYLDEAHLYIKQSDDHQAVCNGGFQKGKPVWRCVGDNHDPEPFDIYGPKCLASIGDLSDTIEDRAIVIEMIRKPRGQHVRPWVRGERIERYELRPIRRKLNRWCLDNAEALREADPEIPHALQDANDRAVDIWRPLFAIADVAGGDWPERARRAAVMLTLRAVESAPETAGSQLLRNVHTIFYPPKSTSNPTGKSPDVMSIAALCGKLNFREDWLWKTYSHGNELTQYTLKKLLAGYGLKSKQKRHPGTGRRERGFWRDELDPVFERYLNVAELRPDDADSVEGVSPPTGAQTSETRVQGGPVPRNLAKTGVFPGRRLSHFIVRHGVVTTVWGGETTLDLVTPMPPKTRSLGPPRPPHEARRRRIHLRLRDRRAVAKKAPL